MNLFRRKTLQKNVKETDNLIMKKNSNKNLYIILGLVFITASGFIIYKSMNINHTVILPKSALKFSSPVRNFSSSVKMQHPMPFSNTGKRLSPVHSNKFAKPDNFNKTIHLKPHLTPQAHTTGNYSSIIYKLTKQIEIEKLKRELAFTKKSKLNAQTIPDGQMSPQRLFSQYPKISSYKKINKLSKYFTGYTGNKNTAALKGVSNTAADVGIGKSNFVVQAGSEFDGYKVLNIGNSSITIVKDGKIKKLYIY
ncbi:MAG: hypothetical protein ACYCT7_04700 [bacterium]